MPASTDGMRAEWSGSGPEWKLGFRTQTRVPRTRIAVTSRADPRLRSEWHAWFIAKSMDVRGPGASVEARSLPIALLSPYHARPLRHRIAPVFQPRLAMTESQAIDATKEPATRGTLAADLTRLSLEQVRDILPVCRFHQIETR